MSGVLNKRHLAHSFDYLLSSASSLVRSGLRTIHNSRYSVVILLIIVTFMSPPLTLLAKSPVANASENLNSSIIVSRSDAENYYITAVNNLRAKQNLKPLVVDSRLTTSSTQKGNDMVLQKYWDHYAPVPNGTSFSEYIWQTSPKATHVGENLARCFETRSEAFDALVASPTHYAVMVGSFTNFGVYEVKDTASGCTYTTMHFSDYK